MHTQRNCTYMHEIMQRVAKAKGHKVSYVNESAICIAYVMRPTSNLR